MLSQTNQRFAGGKDGSNVGGNVGLTLANAGDSTWPTLLGRGTTPAGSGAVGHKGQNLGITTTDQKVGSADRKVASPITEHKDDVGKDLPGKGPISMLQEFVQCSKEFRMPPRQPILQWHFETRMQDYSTLEFQARATFLIAGAPHHAVGAWHPSKKAAQRDSAERALGFFVGRWGEQLLSCNSKQEGPALAQYSHEAGSTASTSPTSSTSPGQMKPIGHEMNLVEQVCRSHQNCNDAPPQWEMKYEDGHYQAFVEVDLIQVPHKFGGPPCSAESEAYAQTARRVLWYFQCPGYEQLYEPDMVPTASALVATPPRWSRRQSEEDTLQLAERKTAVMRIQNRLQQRLAQDLKPGQSVWEWSYETDREDGSWPPLCRATVRIAVLGVDFTGDWVRSHRGAQLDTCDHVVTFLDQYDAKVTAGVAAATKSRGRTNT